MACATAKAGSICGPRRCNRHDGYRHPVGQNGLIRELCFSWNFVEKFQARGDRSCVPNALLSQRFCCCAFNSARVRARSSEGQARARDYSVGGATFGMTLVEFENKFSLPHRTATGNSNTVTREVSVAAGKVARFEFNRGRLSAISVVFTFEGNDRVESEAAVASQTTQVFGKPDRNDDAALQLVVSGGESRGDVRIIAKRLHSPCNGYFGG